jgi:plasmid maintenance system antidote protein VapI
MMACMIIEEIVKAMERSGKTRYRVAVDCEIDHTVLHRLVRGGSCSVETADRLCKYLGLELRPVKKGRKPERERR